jgi:hypothetical protein
MRAVFGGALALKVHDDDASRELTITRGQLKGAYFPERVFARGPVEDFRDGPLAEYRGLDPYIEKAAFESWRRELHADGKKARTKAEETRCKAWLVTQMREGPPAGNKQHYLKIARDLAGFDISDHGFLHRIWKDAVTEAGNAAWSKRGRRKKS